VRGETDGGQFRSQRPETRMQNCLRRKDEPPRTPSPDRSRAAPISFVTFVLSWFNIGSGFLAIH
jgi:hypothetical protein